MARSKACALAVLGCTSAAADPLGTGLRTTNAMAAGRLLTLLGLLPCLRSFEIPRQAEAELEVKVERALVWHAVESPVGMEEGGLYLIP